ncbi:hypothetical protein B296_00035298 [Ensete ventricosum]|uniref:Uncharacterized protein n=1 Tax=Ensete ventricosum TaxID=4639 RepID=A0A426YY65_ENSVE|nr:hypothetical protein B296_00035298 [Ensete ventricosum]
MACATSKAVEQEGFKKGLASLDVGVVDEPVPSQDTIHRGLHSLVRAEEKPFIRSSEQESGKVAEPVSNRVRIRLPPSRRCLSDTNRGVCRRRRSPLPPLPLRCRSLLSTSPSRSRTLALPSPALRRPCLPSRGFVDDVSSDGYGAGGGRRRCSFTF